MQTVKLGLIGDNIASSSAPRLHKLAAAQHGFDLTYDLIIPKTFGFDFDQAFDYVQSQGFNGVNITLPYKEKAFPYVAISEPSIKQLGSVNTICFDGQTPTGHNTDFTGFLKSYRSVRGNKPPGHVLLIGAGGVGRSIAYAIIEMGASSISILDHDHAKAQRLSDELNALPQKQSVGIATAIYAQSIPSCDAVINCTPAGMVGYGGLPLPEDAFPADFEWVFDAVYQPVDTLLKHFAERKGAQFISGFELFFYQGVDAFLIFTGHDVKDQDDLRQNLYAALEDNAKG
jgi:shikimate dehydrogenase